jgi:hypothetical protein
MVYRTQLHQSIAAIFAIGCGKALPLVLNPPLSRR